MRREARTVLSHEVFLRVVREAAGSEAVAAVWVFSWECEVEDGGDIESARRQNGEMVSAFGMDIEGGVADVLVELLGDLVLAHQPRGRPHHGQGAVGDPVRVETPHRGIQLGQGGAFAATFAARATAESTLDFERLLPLARFHGRPHRSNSA
jgi:hypothetical protein